MKNGKKSAPKWTVTDGKPDIIRFYEGKAGAEQAIWNYDGKPDP